MMTSNQDLEEQNFQTEVINIILLIVFGVNRIFGDGIKLQHTRL